MGPVILVVDEDEHFLKILAARLKAEGFRVRTYVNPEDAISVVEAQAVDFVILGDPANGKSALEALRLLKDMSPATEVILLAAQASVEHSIQAMKLGACDCLPKPTSIQDLVDRIHRARTGKARPSSETSAAK
jgi:DNA-binding response OmpR family regulator